MTRLVSLLARHVANCVLGRRERDEQPRFPMPGGPPPCP